MEEFLHQYGYLALSIGTFFEGETAILVASSLVPSGVFDAPQAVLFGFLGSFVSDWVYFLIGRLNGKYFVDRRPALKAKLLPAQEFFERNRLQVLISYRFLYGFRIILPIIIGMSTIRLRDLFFYSLAAGLFWAAVVSTVGFLAGELFQLQASHFEENILFIIAGFGCFGMLVGYGVKRFAEARMGLKSQ